jgi:hypothetical protein
VDNFSDKDHVALRIRDCRHTKEGLDDWWVIKRDNNLKEVIALVGLAESARNGEIAREQDKLQNNEASDDDTPIFLE